jgi:hypothetical protein
VRVSSHYWSIEMRVRRVGGRCDVAAGLQGREPGSLEHPLLEDFTKQRDEDCSLEQQSFRDSDL